MTKRQKAILREFVLVIVITAIAVVAMINLKDWLNRAEAMRALEQLGKFVSNYRQANHSVPPESYIEQVKTELPGYVRLGDLRYRGLWIELDSGPDEILAYTEKNYRWLLVGRGSVVLRLDGRVEWLDKKEFEKILAEQQSPMEKQMMGR